MDTKLTLKLNSKAIKDAKDFAKRNHISLSRIVEELFFALAERPDKDESQYTPIVRELSGVLSTDAAIGYKAEYRKHLEEKYR